MPCFFENVSICLKMKRQVNIVTTYTTCEKRNKSTTKSIFPSDLRMIFVSWLGSFSLSCCLSFKKLSFCILCFCDLSRIERIYCIQGGIKKSSFCVCVTFLSKTQLLYFVRLSLFYFPPFLFSKVTAHTSAVALFPQPCDCRTAVRRCKLAIRKSKRFSLL